MRASRFDELTRWLAADLSRRRLLGGGALIAAGYALAPVIEQGVPAAGAAPAAVRVTFQKPTIGDDNYHPFLQDVHKGVDIQDTESRPRRPTTRECRTRPGQCDWPECQAEPGSIGTDGRPSATGDFNRDGRCDDWQAGPVVAAAAGRVVAVGPAGPAGHRVIIDHGKLPSGERVKTRYLHMGRKVRDGYRGTEAYDFASGEPTTSFIAPEIVVGACVTGGQLIGYQGYSGRTKATHLHFEVLVGDEAVDPKTWFATAGGESSAPFVGSVDLFPPRQCRCGGQDCSSFADSCHDGVCDASGQCLAVAKDDGTSCGENGETCQAGSCEAPPPTAATSAITGFYGLSSPGFCRTEDGTCAPDTGGDIATATFLFSNTIAADQIATATLSFSGGVEMFVGQHDNLVPSNCPVAIDANAFLIDVLGPDDPRSYAGDCVVGIAGTETTFALDQILVFETHPGLGMQWNDRSTQVVDVTDAIRQLLAGGPTDAITVSLQFLAAGCSHESLKFIAASLTLTFG